MTCNTGSPLRDNGAKRHPDFNIKGISDSLLPP